MKKLKTIITMLLVMIMTMSVTASASNNKGDLTVRINRNNTLENQTIKLYKLFDLTTNGTNDAYTVNSEYQEVLKEVLNLMKDNPSSHDYYQAILDLEDEENDSPKVQEFADQFAQKTLENKINPTKMTSKITTGTTEITYNNLDYGYYLVYQSGTKKIQASLISVDKDENEVVLKGESPDITKKEDVKTVEIGETIHYTITGTIPDTTGYENYQYLIEDTLTNGLDYDGNVTVTIQDPIGTPTKANEANINGRTFELDLSNWVRENQENAGKTFTVTYKAIVNKDAIITENNQAYLEYGNDEESIVKTTPRKVKSPTYPLQIKKTDLDGTNMLAGATFKLYTDKDDAEKDENAVTITKRAEGKYIFDKNSSNTEMVSIGQQVDHVTAECNLYLNGLEAGTYYLVETEAPDGYNKLSKPMEVTISPSTVEDETKWTLSAEGADGQVLIVKNNTGTILPSTGGKGTILFSIIAAVLILGVTGSFIRNRKKEI